MKITPIAIVGAQLTAAAATYYTAPANTKSIIKKLTFTNTTGIARTVTVYLVPYAGTAGATNTLISARAIAPGETYDCTEAMGQELATGGFLQALSDLTASLTINGAVAEVVG